MIDRLGDECPRLCGWKIIEQSRFSRSQIYEWRQGRLDRKQREDKVIAEETVASAVSVIVKYPHFGGSKGQAYMLYHRLGFIGMKAYDAMKKHVKQALLHEASKRDALCSRQSYDYERPARVGDIWAEDFTELAVCGQKYRVALLIDVFDQFKLGVSVGRRATEALVAEPVRQALSINHGVGPDKFLLSDNGSQYVGARHGELLESSQIVHQLIPSCKPQYNGCIECEMKTFKSVFYNIWEHREREEANKEKNLLDRVQDAISETRRVLNEEIPRPSLGGVTPADVHWGTAAEKKIAIAHYRDTERVNVPRRPPPWKRTFWSVITQAVDAASMTTKELATKLAFFCRCPLRQIARLNMEVVG